MQQLIMNADDFGLCSGANRAIIQAWEQGILTSASLMMGGEACEEAVTLAHEHPGLQVGLHLTLLQGRSVADHRGFPSITDRDGYFNNDPLLTGIRFFFIQPLKRQIEKEIIAQLEAFLATGLPLTHVDGHLNIHMHPTVFDILIKVMPTYGITSFRLTKERLAAELTISPENRIQKTADAFIFSTLAKRCEPLLHHHGIRCAGEVKGLLNSGAMTEEYLLKALDHLSEGLTEIYCHPGCHPDKELSLWRPGYRDQEELQALLSPKVKEKIAAQGIELVNYRGEVKRV